MHKIIKPLETLTQIEKVEKLPLDPRKNNFSRYKNDFPANQGRGKSKATQLKDPILAAQA